MFQLFDWSIVLVFWRTRFNLNSSVLTSFSIKLLMENKCSTFKHLSRCSLSLHELHVLLFFRGVFAQFFQYKKIHNQNMKLVNSIWFTKLVQLIFHICEKQYFRDRKTTNEINFLISAASQFLKTFFSINVYLILQGNLC